MAIFIESHEWIKPYVDSETWKIFVASEWILLSLYCLLVILILRNIWMILIKQEKWKNRPLLFFYIWSFLAITFRFIKIILGYTENENAWYFFLFD